MKKFLILALSFLMLMGLTACSSSNDEELDSLSVVKQRGKLIIATEGDWAPWTYHDENGKLVGFDVEVGQRIAEIIGVEAQFEETVWDSILAGVESGRFDIACNGVGYTKSRAESYDFSDPYVYTKVVLIVKSDNEDIKSFEDLAGKITGNTASSTYAELAETYGASVKAVDDFSQTIELVDRGTDNGGIDATINSEESYLDYMQQHPETAIKVVDEMAGDIIAFPTRKCENNTLVIAVNDALKQLRDSGELAELSIKYFGEDLTRQ